MRIRFVTNASKKVWELENLLSSYTLEVEQGRHDCNRNPWESLKDSALKKACAKSTWTPMPVVASSGAYYIEGSDEPVLRTFRGYDLQYDIDRIAYDHKGKECTLEETAVLLRARLDPDPIVKTVSKTGMIASESRGDKKLQWVLSDFGTIFQPKGYNKVLAELTEDEFWKWRLDGGPAIQQAAMEYIKEKGIGRKY